MFTGAIAHNDFLSAGRLGDWGSHLIEHEISGIYDVAHGAGLAVVFPAWMKYTYKKDISRFAQFAVRVWNCEYNFSNPELTALEGIKRTEEFYKEIGLPVTLNGLGIKDDRLAEMADKCRRSPEGTTGNCFKMTKEDVLNVLRLTQKNGN